MKSSRRNFSPAKIRSGRIFTDDYLGATQIVGVVDHLKQWGLDDNKVAMHAEFYVPFDADYREGHSRYHETHDVRDASEGRSIELCGSSAA